MTTWDLGGEGNSFGFDTVGDHIGGTVLDLVERQQTDMQTKAPAHWDNGDPKMMSVVTLQTELRDPANPADDGKRTVALAGSKKPESYSRLAAVLAAVKAATGASGLQYGGTLTIQYVGDGVPSQRGFNPPKQYQAWYQPPSMVLDQPVEHKAPPPAPPAPAFATNAGPPPAWAQPAPAAPPALAQPVMSTATGQPVVHQQQIPPPPAGIGYEQQIPPVAPPPAAPWGGQGAVDPWQTGAPVPPDGGIDFSKIQQPPVAPAQQSPPVPAQQPVGATAAAGQAGQPVTPEQVAALRNIGVDPAQVYGPNWQSQVAG